MEDTIPNEIHSLPLPQGHRRRDALLGLLLFVCGCLVGGIVMTKANVSRLESFQRNGIERQHAFGRLKHALDLNAEQAKQVQAIINTGLKDLREIRRSVDPQIVSVLQRIRTDVAAVLDEHQKQLWEKRFDAMRDRWLPPLPGLGGPPKRPDIP